jgi:hypothetical protein
MSTNLRAPVLFAAALLALALPARGQIVAAYSNGRGPAEDPGLSTGGVTLSGVAAPRSVAWSEAARDSVGANSLAAFASFLGSSTGSLRLADDFAVPAGQTWRFDHVRLYAYQRGAPETASPLGGVTIRVWSGRPGQPGSQVIWGDTTTNRLLNSSSTGLYRIFSSTAQPVPQPPDTTRLIWQSDVSLAGLTLSEGTYWLDWQYTPAQPGAQVFSPPVTKPGQRGLPGANAMQFRTSPGVSVPAWAPLMDLGKPSSAADVAQELPFIVYINTGPNGTCPVDYNRDGWLTMDDLTDYLNDYYIQPPIPGGVQGAAPSFPGVAVGFGVPCPGAPDAPAPYSPGAYRQWGYRAGFSAMGSDPCPPGGPNTDNMGDFITAFNQGC